MFRAVLASTILGGGLLLGACASEVEEPTTESEPLVQQPADVAVADEAQVAEEAAPAPVEAQVEDAEVADAPSAYYGDGYGGGYGGYGGYGRGWGGGWGRGGWGRGGWGHGGWGHGGHGGHGGWGHHGGGHHGGGHHGGGHHGGGHHGGGHHW